MAKTVELELTETKKHSGKYVEVGTEGNMYPTFFYLPKVYFGGSSPQKVKMTVEEVKG